MADFVSVRDTLNATMDELSADPGAEPTPQAGAEPSANGAQGAPAAETAAVEAAPAGAAKSEGEQPAADRARGPDGKFVPKTESPAAEGAQAAAPLAEPKPETAQPAGAEPQATETTRPPPSLPAAIKAKFAALDPDVQQAFVALEGSVQTAKAEWTGKGQRLNRYDEIIGPHVDRWRVAGLDEFSGIQSLIAAQSMLDKDPVAGLLQIARSYSLTPAHLAQAFGLSQTSAPQSGQEGQPAPTASPDLQAALQQHLTPVLQQVQTVQQRLEQLDQQSEAAEIGRLAAQIQEFAGKPENMYFDNVSDDVVKYAQQLNNSGKPVTMDLIAQAYERAIWADPEIRPLLIKAQADAAAQETTRKAEDARKAAEQAARDKASRAGHAGGSVTGNPSPGSGPAVGVQGSVRESLMAAMQEHSGV